MVTSACLSTYVSLALSVPRTPTAGAASSVQPCFQQRTTPDTQKGSQPGIPLVLGTFHPAISALVLQIYLSLPSTHSFVCFSGRRLLSRLDVQVAFCGSCSAFITAFIRDLEGLAVRPLYPTTRSDPFGEKGPPSLSALPVATDI